jgi:hypothetical protein
LLAQTYSLEGKLEKIIIFTCIATVSLLVYDWYSKSCARRGWAAIFYIAAFGVVSIGLGGTAQHLLHGAFIALSIVVLIALMCLDELPRVQTLTSRHYSNIEID